MRRLTLAFACLALVACGDDSSAKATSSGVASPTPGATPSSKEALSSNDLEALAAQAHGASGAAGQRAAQELRDAIRDRLAPTLEEDAKKATAFAARPLTAADVELYLDLVSRVKEAAATQGAAAALLAERGLSGMEWGALSGRIGALRRALSLPPGQLEPKTGADVETLRPFADRLEAALR